MIDIDELERILEKRKNMHPNDPRICDIWNELAQIFIQSEESTIEYLNSCSKEKLYWISEVFEDISLGLQSTKFIECIEKLNIKYPDLDLKCDVRYAKNYLL